ncbi:MAG: DUF2336 domain-containing protein [Proteobacteria bacterium]|nr:DUF2336 domain-containing protein [Pseudomonadota bacterium]
MLSKLFSKGNKPPAKKIGYEEAKKLASDPDDNVRADIAARTDLKPEILYFLAADPSAEIRRIIAANATAPRQADLLLSRDADVTVRESLAEKISRVAPGLSAAEADKLRTMTYDALSTLARDQAVRVRQILAEALKEVANAPPDVIRKLAWDAEIAVAVPILRFSPVLTDEDLLKIISARPNEGSISAIAERNVVSENVCDAIIDSDDRNAIGLLLGNASAQIREAALDRVINQAIDVDAWHQPLAMRPGLTEKAALKIARFVADDMLRRMAARDDLPAATLTAVRAVVERRIEDRSDLANNGVDIDADDSYDRALKLWSDGKLNESALMAAIGKGEKRLAMAMLSVMADVPIKVVERTCQTKNAKGCAAVSWKAGISAKFSETVQQRLAGIPTNEAIHANGDAYALTDEELTWQVDFIKSL